MTRQKFAGILAVLQGFLTQAAAKFAEKTCAILDSIAKCPIDFEIKFCQTRRKPQGRLSPVEDLQRRMAKF